MKYISTGGLGDAYIVNLKLKQQNEANIEWLHVESNEIVPKLCRELFGSDKNEFLCDPNYIENYRANKWKELIPVSSGVDSWCPLKGETGIRLEKPFENNDQEKKYDIVLQVAAGAKNGRKWNFDPIQAQKMLKALGFNVILVGTDEKYKNENDDANFVGKLSISDTLDIIRKSNTFIGLSGFLNYFACANRIKNVHWIESPEHDERYYHEEWRNYTSGIKIGSLQEIIREVK